MSAPGIGLIEILLQSRPLGELLCAGVPERVEVEHVVRCREPVVHHHGAQRPAGSPLLEGTQAQVHSVSLLAETRAPRVEQVHAVDAVQAGPEHARPEGEPLAGYSHPEHGIPECIVVRAIGAGELDTLGEVALRTGQWRV